MILSGFYVLRNKIPVPVEDLRLWAKEFEAGNRIVKQTRFRTTNKDTIFISTVFLGIDHNFKPGGPPVLFETMIFGGRYDGYQNRYCTYEAAERGHEDAVNMVMKEVEQLN